MPQSKRNLKHLSYVACASWHVKRAIGDRLRKEELATTSLYNPHEVHSLFDFVDPSFISIAAADPLSTLSSLRARSIPRLEDQPANSASIADDHSPPAYLHPSFCQKACSGPDFRKILEKKGIPVPQGANKPALLSCCFRPHTLLPGPAFGKTKDEIHHWAVKEAYNFCVDKALTGWEWSGREAS
ncbi:hypothetical protein B9479_004454 [Cryptococcus floricola]|uniref:Uncharacterized protein n=1 Tax=Cryptococcus floricola TaxID=2591691 RepID=A0A5D3AVI2_9TREE|nr:hypothetical protein B9479_004454 [Cryptococcus floricola]